MAVWNLLERQFNVFTRRFKEKSTIFLGRFFLFFVFWSPHKPTAWHDPPRWRMPWSPLFREVSREMGGEEVFFFFLTPLLSNRMLPPPPPDSVGCVCISVPASIVENNIVRGNQPSVSVLVGGVGD